MLTALHCAAQDLTRLLLGAMAMLTRATLQSRLHVVIEPSDQYLRHDQNDSTLSRRVGWASLARQLKKWFVCRPEKWSQPTSSRTASPQFSAGACPWETRNSTAVADLGHGRRKTECVPMRRQRTCASPDRTSAPYSKVARPSGAQVISQTPGWPCTRLTRRRGWKL